ncbi:MAG TPA: type VI secretion system-associated FHA domain protein TagH [Burkholderiales bacterium]|nr:type VI secretion system-associated FHA domain protein TagH [Burkholderiales bacterium]
MLKIEATTLANQPLLEPLHAEFDEMGGSIGRAEGNTLVLPDDKRYISRTQAEVAFRGGMFVLRDLGSATPTLVNGTAVGSGNEVPIRNGDELRIGEYSLRATLSGRALAAAAPAPVLPDDPFADLLPAPAAQPPVQPNAYAAPAPHDPFGLPPASGGPQHAGGIPADFDPFADLLPQATPAPAPRSAAAPAADPLNLTPAAGQSVDDLFGLKQSSTWDPLGPQDPLAGHGTDPLAPFAPEKSPQPASQRDDAPILSGAFQMPRPKPEITDPPPRAAVEPPPAPKPAAPPAAGNPGGMMLSWDTAQDDSPTEEIKTVILPSPKRAAAAAKPQQDFAPRIDAPIAPQRAPAPPPAQPAPPAAAPYTAPAHAPAPTAPSAPPDALLAAFLEGARATELKLPPGGLTPELMHLIGRLMHESLRGTLDLLLARALTKREVRAQATVIVARENNPLKFSPTVDAAFQNLLNPQGRGFMTAADAMRDAYNDLRSHQFGFMAGMRAALEGVLGRFDPVQLEGRLTKKSVLGSILPGSRRARLWELYEQLYREISKEAQDDFQTLFGKEFLRAYEAQIDKLEQEDAANQR